LAYLHGVCHIYILGVIFGLIDQYDSRDTDGSLVNVGCYAVDAQYFVEWHDVPYREYATHFTVGFSIDASKILYICHAEVAYNGSRNSTCCVRNRGTFRHDRSFSDCSTVEV